VTRSDHSGGPSIGAVEGDGAEAGSLFLEAARLYKFQAGWTVVLLAVGQWAWRRSRQRITIQGG